MILKERPENGESYGWCPKCSGFVLALGRYCYNDDSHIVDHLSPQEREELKTDEILGDDWKSDPSRKTPPEPVKKPEPVKEPEEPMSKRLTIEQKTQAKHNGEKILQYRKRFGISVGCLHTALGISRGAFLTWESGKVYPPDSMHKFTRKDVYTKLMEIIEQEERNPDPDHNWESFWGKKEIEPRARLKKAKPVPQDSEPQSSKKSTLNETITELIREIVREEIKKEISEAFRELADRIS